MTCCRCLVVITAGETRVRNYCSEEVHDAPFCPACEGRHADKVDHVGEGTAAGRYEVLTVPLDETHPWEDA